jgi:hypothetical protein
MTGITPEQGWLIMWLTFTAAATLGVSGVLIWAVRSRQFTHQDRARFLPLMSGIPEEEAKLSKVQSAKFSVEPGPNPESGARNSKPDVPPRGDHVSS